MAAPEATAVAVGATDYVDDDTLQAIVLVCSVLSVVATTAMGVCFVCIERLRAYPARLTFYLGLSNWFWFVSILSGIVDVDSRSDTVCKYAGPLNQVFGLTSIFWTCCIALHMALIIAKDTPPSPRWELGYHAFVWATPVALVTILLVTLRHSTPDYLRTDSAVCYVATDHKYLRLITQSGPSIAGFAFNIVAYSFAWWKARRTAQLHETDGADPLVVARHKAVVQRVLSSGSKYLIVYLISWAPSIGQDIALLTSDSVNDLEGLVWLVYLSQGIFFAQGLSNTIVYVWSKWHVFAAVWQSRKSARRVSDIGTALLRPGRNTRQDSMYDSEFHMDADDYMPQQYFSEDSAAFQSDGYSYAQRVASRRLSDASMPSFAYPDEDRSGHAQVSGPRSTPYMPPVHQAPRAPGGLAVSHAQASGPRSAPYLPPFQQVPRASSAMASARGTDRVATLRAGVRPHSSGSEFHGSTRSRSGELGTSARSTSASVLMPNAGSFEPPQITRGVRATSNGSRGTPREPNGFLYSSAPGARSYDDASNVQNVGF